ncbi:flagellar basal-body rod protein FlgC [Salmonella enterica subsp. enterica]|uniref:Flagellar basal-body rod protein FlgC n=1 Tax=Salmonella enterica I TaxID=59201 RepID=A0A447U4Y6_SALET|nr:flagellar basal-body rod protein FlgC [Salmonella enterica subsp. enterica]
MALLNIFDIAGSALAAQSKRLNVAASNLANADSVTGPDGQPYRAKQVVFQVDAAPGQATGGVKVASVIESQAPEKLVYEPGNPLADANGYVKMPNVDVGRRNGQHDVSLAQLSGKYRSPEYRKKHDA